MKQGKKSTRKERKVYKKAEKNRIKEAKKEKAQNFNNIRDTFFKSVIKFIVKSPVFLFYSLALCILGIILLGIALTSLYYVGLISFLYFMSLLILLLSGWIYAFKYYLNEESGADEK